MEREASWDFSVESGPPTTLKLDKQTMFSGISDAESSVNFSKPNISLARRSLYTSLEVLRDEYSTRKSLLTGHGSIQEIWEEFVKRMEVKETRMTSFDEKDRSLCTQLVFRYIDKNQEKFIDSLKSAVSIPSVSAWETHRTHCEDMINFARDRLKELGFTITLHTYDRINDKDATDLKIPPILLATKGEDQTKNTVLIYGHLDVQPAKQSDGWDTDPFELVEKNGKLYGRGSTDDKGPVMGWIHALEAYVKQNICLPVNIKIILESMEECGSVGLEKLLTKQRLTFLRGVDLVTVSDNYWLGTSKPCLTYGLRGLAYFFCEVECGDRDLHSGIFGGAVREGMADLLWLLAQLTDNEGNIKVPGILDDVAPVTPEEGFLYENLEFSLSDFKDESGVYGLRFPDDKTATLMHRWRFPSLSIHGIQGAFSDPGCKTVIPRKVIGKFSIRLVPNQVPKKVEEKVMEYMQAVWETRRSPNKMKVYMSHGAMPWLANPEHPNYIAASRATENVYGLKPDLTREGGSIPVTLVLQVYVVGKSVAPFYNDPFQPSYVAARQSVYWAYNETPSLTRLGSTLTRIRLLQELTGKTVLLLPMGCSDDGAHSQNEKIDIENYIKGTKVFASYLEEIGKIPKSQL